MKTTIRNSIGGLLLIPLVLVCFGLSPAARAVVPAPDGGYPGYNTAEGQNPLLNLAGGVWNTALGAQALHQDTTGNVNTAVGLNALYFNNGSANVAVGSQTLQTNSTGGNNNAIGNFALFGNSVGNDNVAVGHQALLKNTASGNTAVGFRAGVNQTTGGNNIYINDLGLAGETNVLAIGGLSSTGTAYTATYIGGIFGATSTSGVAVLVNSDGKLGTTTSSRRFKDEIKPMEKASEALLALKPVTFRYKKEIDPIGTAQFGLVAEEVEKVNPDLIVRDKEGKPYSVRYDQVNAMLLNEFLKEHGTVQELKSTVAKQEALIAQQQKGMEVLAASLKEQASQIQKVSARLELNKPAPRTVLNNP